MHMCALANKMCTAMSSIQVITLCARYIFGANWKTKKKKEINKNNRNKLKLLTSQADNRTNTGEFLSYRKGQNIRKFVFTLVG